jgi:hypothetical protein
MHVPPNGDQLAVPAQLACGCCAARQNLASFAQRNGLTAQTRVLPTSPSAAKTAALSWRAAAAAAPAPVPLKRFSVKRRPVDHTRARRERRNSRAPGVQQLLALDL